MSLRAKSVDGRYNIVHEEIVGTGYLAVRVTPYVLVGLKSIGNGMTQYDFVAESGQKILSIANTEECYVHSSDMIMNKDYFVVTYHQKIDSGEMINQVAYDYTGNKVDLTLDQYKSNREYFSHEPVSSKVISEPEIDDDVM